jgi:hypothetical protein
MEVRSVKCERGSVKRERMQQAGGVIRKRANKQWIDRRESTVRFSMSQV